MDPEYDITAVPILTPDAEGAWDTPGVFFDAAMRADSILPAEAGSPPVSSTGAGGGPCNRLPWALAGVVLAYLLAPKSSRILYAAGGGVAGYLLAPHACALLGSLKGAAGLGSTDHPPRSRGRKSDY